MKSGYIRRSDLVLEQKLGRYLIRPEIAHHINENKQDDSPCNLEVMTTAEHTRHHKIKHGPIHRRPLSPSNRRYSWPADDVLLAMAASNTLRALSSILGPTWSVIGRRIKKIKLKTS